MSSSARYDSKDGGHSLTVLQRDNVIVSQGWQQGERALASCVAERECCHQRGMKVRTESTHKLCCRERMSLSARDHGDDGEHSHPAWQRDNVVSQG